MNNLNPSKALQGLQKANRQVGDSHPKKPNLVWTEYKPGKFDWRNRKAGSNKKSNSNNSTNSGETRAQKLKKLKNTLAKKDDDALRGLASKPGNNVELRQFAYEELENRGVDVSDIDMNNGKLGQLKQQQAAFSGEDENLKTPSPSAANAADNENELDPDDTEWSNPEYVKKKFGGLRTKAQRIAADEFVHQKKTSQDNYVPPIEEIYDLNGMYYNFLQTESPLMIVSGGAGVGKTYNFHKTAEIAGKKPFEPGEDDEGDQDYDYVEAPEIKSEAQFAQVLKQHNGKTIVFDDSDNILKEPDTLGMMKKATASGGKRIIGKKSTNKNSNVDPFEFDGKIVFLTNMTADQLTKNPNIDAIYSRAVKKDIQFTKKEQLSFIGRIKDLADFTGVERLDDPQEDKKERKEVFDIIADNIDKVDPQKFNSRTMKEALEAKRTAERVNAAFDNDNLGASLASQMFGQQKDWKKEVEKLLTKGQNIDNIFEKAINHFNLN